MHFPFFVQCKFNELLALAEQVSYCKLSIMHVVYSFSASTEASAPAVLSLLYMTHLVNEETGKDGPTHRENPHSEGRNKGGHTKGTEQSLGVETAMRWKPQVRLLVYERLSSHMYKAYYRCSHLLNVISGCKLEYRNLYSK